MKLVGNAGIVLEIDCDDRFDVRQFHVTDGLSQSFRVELVATSSNPAVDFEAVVGKSARFRLDLHGALRATTPSRVWSGLVAEIHQTGEEEAGLSTYAISLAPRLWLLEHRTNCRVYQQMTDLEIVLELLKEWQIEPTVLARRPQKTRKYRVQYQESDFTFLSRLCEASGVTFFHQQVGDESKLVLADAPEQVEPRKEPLEHVGEPVIGTVWARRLRAIRRLRQGKITFADHDHRLPNDPLVVGSETGNHPVEAQLERFVYDPGAFRFGVKGPADTPHADDRGRTRTDRDEGQRIAAQAAAALVAKSQRFSFESNALDLGVGQVVKMTGHARAEKHPRMLVTDLGVSGGHDEEPTLLVEAVDAARPYAPEAVTATPVAQGVECATVVGPPGQTIHCDEFGRVRVQFHWDRYGNNDHFSSCWVHVSQPWAGDGLGGINVPRVGQEVVVGFLAGNPEEPVVVGRLFTNLLRPPFPLPAAKTQNGFRSASVPATGGYNELMFEDSAGGELIRMRAERDFTTRVNRNHEMSIGADRKAVVDGFDREHVEKDRKQTVGGKVTSAIAGQLMSSVGADKVLSVLGSIVSSAGGERLQSTIGSSVSQALSHSITSEVATTITVGASMIHIGPDCIVIQSPKVLLNPGEEVAANAAMGGPVSTPSE
jgi:type VI secretion system secreted protein VgrG